MNIKSYDKGAVIFRQGDPGDCMYDIQFGKVGIFDHYGEPDEKKIADLYIDQIFGEMGLLDHAPRSATAVALEKARVPAKAAPRRTRERTIPRSGLAGTKRRENISGSPAAPALLPTMDIPSWWVRAGHKTFPSQQV